MTVNTATGYSYGILTALWLDFVEERLVTNGDAMSSWLNVTPFLQGVDPPRFGLRSPYSRALVDIYKVSSRSTQQVLTTIVLTLRAQNLALCCRSACRAPRVCRQSVSIYVPPRVIGIVSSLASSVWKSRV